MKKKLLFTCVLWLSTVNLFSQNIGINTDGTAAETGVMLDIKGTTDKAVTATSTLFQVKSFNTSTNELKMRMILHSDAAGVSSRYAQIDAADYTAGTPTYVNLVFQPSGGNVGIGTIAPGSVFSVVGTAVTSTVHSSLGSTQLRFKRTAGDETNAGTIDYRGFDANALGIVGAGTASNRLIRMWEYLGINAAPSTAQALNVSAGSATYAAIFQGGNVGIGTASPGTKLTVSTTASTDGIQLDGTTNPSLTFSTSGTVRGRIGMPTAGSAYDPAAALGDIVFRTETGGKFLFNTNNGAGTAALTILGSNGNTGIGTTAPNTSAQLEVGDGTDNKGLLLPRVALTSATDAATITSPSTSLLVYNTASGGLSPAGYYYNSGTAGSPNWAKMSSSASGGTCCSDWTLVAVANSTDAGFGYFSSGYTIKPNKEYLIFGVWSTVDFTAAITDNVFLLEYTQVVDGAPNPTVNADASAQSAAYQYYKLSTPLAVTVEPNRLYFCGKRLNGNAGSSFDFVNVFINAFMLPNILGDGTIRIYDNTSSNDYALYIFER